MSLLHLGDTFPELTLTIPGGKTVTVPMAFAGRSASCCSTEVRGVSTATPSCAPSKVPVPRDPCQSMWPAYTWASGSGMPREMSGRQTTRRGQIRDLRWVLLGLLNHDTGEFDA